MSFWQPMKTAPMDGTEILIKTRHGIVSAWFCNEPGIPGSDDGTYHWICYDDEFKIEGHDSVIEAWAPIPK